MYASPSLLWFASGEYNNALDASATPHLHCKRKNQDGKVDLGQSLLTPFQEIQNVAFH